MLVFAVHSHRCSHLGFVHAANVDAAMNLATNKWWNAFSIRECPKLEAPCE